MEMGCYGIGVSRIVGAAIEQGHDARGIVFPAAIAPFEVAIVPMGYTKSDSVKASADKLYAELRAAGIDVVLDDRNERPGVMFADWGARRPAPRGRGRTRVERRQAGVQGAYRHRCRDD